MEDKKKKWTVMIYQAGDNNLSEECVYALKELKRLGTKRMDNRPDEVEPPDDPDSEKKKAEKRLKRRKGKPRTLNILAQFDPTGRANNTRLFHVGDKDDDGVIECDVVKVLDGETDTGAHETLTDFLVFCIENFPADYYLVVLAGHGNGTDQDFFLRDETRPFSLLPSSLSIPDLQKVFKQTKEAEEKTALEKILEKTHQQYGSGERINILGFDTCVMSMAEVCYQLRDSLVDLMVGSEGFGPTAGWPYHRVLRGLDGEREIKPEKLAERIVKRYARFYVNYEFGGLSVDISALRVKNIGKLKDKVKILTNTLTGKLKQEYLKLKPGDKRNRAKGYEFPRPRFIDAIIMSHWEAQSYNGEQFVDLYDFCNILRRRYNEEWYDNEKCKVDIHEAKEDEKAQAREVRRACEGVMRAILGPNHPKLGVDEVEPENMDAKDAVLLASCYNGPTFQYSHGVSVYFPWSCTEFANHYFHDDDSEPMRLGRVPLHSHLDFPLDKHSGWGTFLQFYFKATVLRGPRSDKVRIEVVRSGPPATKGPNAPVHSMRNPPLYFVRPDCADKSDKNDDEQQQGGDEQQQDGEKS